MPPFDPYLTWAREERRRVDQERAAAMADKRRTLNSLPGYQMAGDRDVNNTSYWRRPEDYRRGMSIITAGMAEAGRRAALEAPLLARIATLEWRLARAGLGDYPVDADQRSERDADLVRRAEAP